MDPQKVLDGVQALGLNLYDFALCTPQGIFHRHAQPCGNCANSYSVAKVFIMTAIGMLVDDGVICTGDAIGKYLEIPAGADPRYHDVTIHHALTHTIGYDEGFLDIDTEDASAYPSDDYLSLVFSHPLAFSPGNHEQYSDAAFYLLSRVVAAAAEESADRFLSRRLLRPLGFREAAWSCCPMHHPIGATGLYISAQDMVKLGALYLNEGVYGGMRLLSREWTACAAAKGYELHPLSDQCDLIGKWGMYGQLLTFSREKQFAFASHAHMTREDSQRLIDYLASL